MREEGHLAGKRERSFVNDDMGRMSRTARSAAVLAAAMKDGLGGGADLKACSATEASSGKSCRIFAHVLIPLQVSSVLQAKSQGSKYVQEHIFMT